MDSLFQLLFLGPIGTVANSAVSLYSWLANCMSGSCGVTPASVTEIFTGIGANLGSTTAFLGSVASKLIAGLFAYLPMGGGLPTVIHQGAQYFGSTLATVNFFLPVSTLVYCMTLVFSVKVALWAFHFLRTVLSFGRGIGSNNFRF